MTIVYKFNNGQEKNIEYDDPDKIEKFLNEIKFFIMANVISKKIDLTKSMKSKFDIVIDDEKIESNSDRIASIELKLK